MRHDGLNGWVVLDQARERAAAGTQSSGESESLHMPVSRIVHSQATYVVSSSCQRRQNSGGGNFWLRSSTNTGEAKGIWSGSVVLLLAVKSASGGSSRWNEAEGATRGEGGAPFPCACCSLLRADEGGGFSPRAARESTTVAVPSTLKNALRAGLVAVVANTGATAARWLASSASDSFASSSSLVRSLDLITSDMNSALAYTWTREKIVKIFERGRVTRCYSHVPVVGIRLRGLAMDSSQQPRGYEEMDLWTTAIDHYHHKRNVGPAAWRTYAAQQNSREVNQVGSGLRHFCEPQEPKG